MYTWDDIIDLEPLWKKTFDGDSLPKRNLSTTMGHSTGLIREQCPVW